MRGRSWTLAEKAAFAARKTKERDLELLKSGLFKKVKKENNVTNEAKKEKKPLGPCDVVTPIFRGSYVTLFEARPPDPNKPNEKVYGVEMWFRVAEKCDERLKDQPIVKIDDLVKACTAAAAEKWGVDTAKWPKGLKNPIKKGESLTGKNGTLEGGIVVRTNRKESFGRPVVVDQNVKDIIDKDLVYSGAYFIAKVHAYAWEHPTGGKGVSFTLDMVQLHHDGEPLGNRLEAADAFAAIPVPGGQPAGAASSAAPATAAAGVFGDLG